MFIYFTFLSGKDGKDGQNGEFNLQMHASNCESNRTVLKKHKKKFVPQKFHIAFSNVPYVAILYFSFYSDPLTRILIILLSYTGKDGRDGVHGDVVICKNYLLSKLSVA